MGHTYEWLLPVSDKCTSQEGSVKTCVKESNIFLFAFIFLGNFFCTKYHFNFLKLFMAPLILKIILINLFLFLLNSKHKYLDWRLSNRFFKTFHILLHLFNCLHCFERKLMTKTTDLNFISSIVKAISNSLERLKTFSYLKENISYNGVISSRNSLF